MIRDYFKGSNIFDISSGEKISYAVSIPYRYADVQSLGIESIATSFEECFSDGKYPGSNGIDGVMTYMTEDRNYTFGNRVIIVPKPYEGIEPFMKTEPEIMKTIRESGKIIETTFLYYNNEGELEWIGCRSDAAKNPMFPAFYQLEGYCDLKSSLINDYSYHPFTILWFNCKDDSKVSIEFSDPCPIQLNGYDFVKKRDESHYRNLKIEFYDTIRNSGIITDDEHSFILDSSPRMQQSSIKILWENGVIVRKELESVDVYEFEDV